jgi:anti-sigma B factor antagonist
MQKQDKPPEQIFQISNTPDHTIVSFYGHVDADIVQQIKPLLQEKIPAACMHLIVDLQQVEFLDSHGVGLFVSLLKRVHGNNGKLVFLSAEGQPASVLHMVGFGGPLVIFCTDAEEAKALRGKI